jgi:hypothetical protein
VCKRVTVCPGIYILKYSAPFQVYIYIYIYIYTKWFKYDWDYLCVKKSQFVPVIFEPPCIYTEVIFLFSAYVLEKTEIELYTHYTRLCLWRRNVTI